MRRCLIAYDVATAATREACARRLEKAGRRIQKSVFVVEAAPGALERLEQDLQLLLGEADSLLILPICANCLAGATFSGPAAPLLIMVYHKNIQLLQILAKFPHLKLAVQLFQLLT